MFQIIGGNLDSLLLAGFGAIALFYPAKIVKKDGTAEEIAKRVKVAKRCGAVMLLAGIGLLSARLVG